jgi:hypothetical protein
MLQSGSDPCQIGLDWSEQLGKLDAGTPGHFLGIWMIIFIYFGVDIMLMNKFMYYLIFVYVKLKIFIILP